MSRWQFVKWSIVINAAVIIILILISLAAPAFRPVIFAVIFLVSLVEIILHCLFFKNTKH